MPWVGWVGLLAGWMDVDLHGWGGEEPNSTPSTDTPTHTHMSPSNPTPREVLEERYRALEVRGAPTRQVAASATATATAVAAPPRTTNTTTSSSSTTATAKLLSPGQQQPRVAPSGAGGASPVRAPGTNHLRMPRFN